MAETYQSPEPNEALLSSLFGTPEDLEAQSARRAAEAEAERSEHAPTVVEQLPLIEDDWETEGMFIG